jgi:hypothetical protein
VPPGEGLCPSGGPLGRGQTLGRGQPLGRGETPRTPYPLGRSAVLPWAWLGYARVGWCASDSRELSFTGCRVPGAEPPRRRPFYRVAKILEIGEGTSEVQRMLIARETWSRRVVLPGEENARAGNPNELTITGN